MDIFVEVDSIPYDSDCSKTKATHVLQISALLEGALAAQQISRLLSFDTEPDPESIEKSEGHLFWTVEGDDYDHLFEAYPLEEAKPAIVAVTVYVRTDMICPTKNELDTIAAKVHNLLDSSFKLAHQSEAEIA